MSPEPAELRNLESLVIALKMRRLTEENRLYRDVINGIGTALAIAMADPGRAFQLIEQLVSSVEEVTEDDT